MSRATSDPWACLGAGLVGAVTLNLFHEGARHIRGDAPRVDAAGKRLVERASNMLGIGLPGENTRYGLALAGDLVANSIYFAAFMRGRVEHPWLRGLAAGVSAGLSATWVASLLGLAKPASQLRTRGMTVVWYMAGGLAAAAAYTLLQRRR